MFSLHYSNCLSQKRALAACKLLAWSSKNVKKEAFNYAMEGKLVDLAVLAIVARKKVFKTLPKSAGIDGRMTILQCLKNQILSLVDEEMNLMAKFEHEKVTQIQSKDNGYEVDCNVASSL